MNPKPISQKEGHEFEGDLGGIYDNVWMEKNEGRNVIIISKMLKIKKNDRKGNGKTQN